MRSIRLVALCLFLLAGGVRRTAVYAQSTGGAAGKQSAAAADTQTPAQREQAARQRKRAAADAKFYYERGLEYGRAKLYYDASKFFRRALMYRPDYADAYFGLGQAYAYLERWPEAVEAYEQVLRLDARDEEAYQALGEAYVKWRAASAVGNARSAAATPPDQGMQTAPTPSVQSAPADVKPQPQPLAAAPAVVAPAASLPAAQAEAAEGTGTTPAAGTKVSAAAVEASAAASATPATTTPARDEGPVGLYRVGPGDVLQIRLLNAPVRNQPTLYDVRKDGQLDYPLAGPPLQVAGLTTDEIAARLTAAPTLHTISEAPRMLVGVHEYASHVISVSGLVNDPGEKVLRREAIPLYVVLAAAQPQPEAGQVRIVSAAMGARTVVYDPTGGGAMSSLIYPGDQVTVEAAPAQFFTIKGLVQQPGQKRFHAGLTLTQAVLLAGGIKEGDVNIKTVKQAMTHDGPSDDHRAKYKVVLVRRDEQGRVTQSNYRLRHIEQGKTPDPALRPDDTLTVMW